MKQLPNLSHKNLPLHSMFRVLLFIDCVCVCVCVCVCSVYDVRGIQLHYFPYGNPAVLAPFLKKDDFLQ